MRPTLTLFAALLLAPLAALHAEVITNSIGMKLVRIEPGSFSMGQDGPRADYSTMSHGEKCDDADWDERPVHRVSISTAFQMAATEVTIAQYRQFKPSMKATGTDDEAVTDVSWHDAMKFCEWLSTKEGKTYRLPTEAEWEYACRAGTTTPFSTGERLPDGFQKFKMNSKVIGRFFTKAGKFPSDYRDWPKEAPLRVAQTPANAWGLFDVHGNVEEWCLDWYGPYEVADAVDPVGRVDGDFRITRGGSHDVFSRMLRSANRSGRLAETTNDKIGFRIVLAELPKTAPLAMTTPPLNARDVSQAPAPKPAPVTKPFFSGPNRFVKVPPDLAGPLFSNHNHSPAIAECPNGDLLAVWFSCGDEGGPELAVIASRLRRGATEWEEASPFWDGPEINDHAPKLWFDGDKTLFFFAKGLSGDVMRTSTDSGATWSKGQVFQPEAEIGNMPIRTREGFMVLPLDGNKPGASLNISRDGGKTWTFTPSHGKPDWRAGATSVKYAGIHNAIEQLADGRFIAFGRVDTPDQQKPFNFRTPVGYSSDWGKTWQLEASPFPAIGSVQRAVLLRLHEGPLLFCSFTDEQRYWTQRKGMKFKADDGIEFTGYGMFAAVSFDEGKTWPVRRLITPGGQERTLPSVDHRQFILSDTMAEAAGYLGACQTRDDQIQLISSKNHYVFNLAWLKQLPPAPTQASVAVPAPPIANVIVNPGPPYADDARSWQGIPGVERAPNGRLWVTWYSGDLGEGAIGNYALAATSGDDGKSWTKPVVVMQGPPGTRIGDPLPWLDPKGRLWIFWSQFTQRNVERGTPDLKNCFAIRTDDPDSANPKWSKPFLVAEGGILFGKPIVRASGGWVAPFFVHGKPSWSEQMHGKETGTLLSTDEGASWQWLGGTHLPKDLLNFSEATLAQRKDGSLWMVIRTNKGLYESTSTDDGRTWSEAIPMPGFAGTATRACMKRLASGAFVLIYHDSLKPRPGRERLTVWLSDDEGRTWPHKLLLDDRTRVSYPDATQAPDGRLYIAYDHGRYEPDEKQVLVSIIREEDIRAGKLVSKDARTQLVVNQATAYGNSNDLRKEAAKKSKQ